MTTTPARSIVDHPTATGPRPAPVAAWLTLLMSWATVVATVVTWARIGPPWDLTMWFTAADVVVAAVYGTLAWVLLRRLRTAVVWIFALAAVGAGVAGFAGVYGLAWDRDPDLWGATWIVPFVGTAWIPGILALVVVVPWLIRSGPLTNVGRAGVATGAVLCAAVTVVRATHPYPWPLADPFMPLGIRSEAWGRFVDDALPWLFLGVVGVGVAATVDVFVRWRRRTDRCRRGLGWLTIGSGLMALSFVPLAIPTWWTDGSITIATTTPVMMMAAQAFLPAALLVSILGQRLWDTDLAVSRGLLRWLLTGALVGTYAVLVLVVGVLVPDDRTAQLIAVVAAAVVLAPVRTWLQREVDRLVHGEAPGPAGALDLADALLHGPASGDELLREVAEGLRRSARLASVSIEGGRPGRPPVTAGVAEGPEHRIPLVAPGRPGRIPAVMVVTAPFGVALDERSRRSLDAFALVVSAALAMADLTRDLSEAEARLTSARLEERRILRRDLHDGLGPALAGIGLGLQAHRNLREVDPVAADELLDTLTEEVSRQAEEVRQLSRTLLPPVLEELGLAAALGELVERHAAPGQEVRVHAEVPVALPTPLAAAAYAIASEALHNARRHGNATTVDIRVRVRDELELVIRDDGTGFDASSTPGVGLRSMRERAEELGGRSTIEAGDEGVTVRAFLPLAVAS